MYIEEWMVTLGVVALTILVAYIIKWAYKAGYNKGYNDGYSDGSPRKRNKKGQYVRGN